MALLLLTLEAEGKAFDALAGGRLLRARLAGRASLAGRRVNLMHRNTCSGGDASSEPVP